MILNKKTRTEKTLPNLDTLLKSFEEKEIKLSGNNLLNTIQANTLDGLSKGRS